MLDLKLILCYVYSGIPLQILHQTNASENQNTSSCREWNVVLFVPELKVTGKPMMAANRLTGQNHFFAEGL